MFGPLSRLTAVITTDSCYAVGKQGVRAVEWAGVGDGWVRVIKDDGQRILIPPHMIEKVKERLAGA